MRPQKAYGLYKKRDIWYYRVRTPEGERRSYSTGSKSKTKAHHYCLQLYKEDKLIPVYTRDLKFSVYCRDFFDYKKCEYIQSALKRGKSFSKQHAYIQRCNLTKYLLPYFGHRSLDQLTSKEIEAWLYGLPEGKWGQNHISSKTANNVFKALRVILNEAERLQDIKENPVKKVRMLGDNTKKRDIPKRAEIQALFNPETKDEVWGDRTAYVGSLLAAVTGMRVGEIRGLLKDSVFEDRIIVQRSFDNRACELKDVKNHTPRTVPIPRVLAEMIYKIMDGNTEGEFVFSNSKGLSPVHSQFFLGHMKRAFKAIGVSMVEQGKRNLVFHSFRIFANTTLLLGGVAAVKVRSIIGHLDKDMTDYYTNVSFESFDREEALSVNEIQSRILLGCL